ncbi:retropepsin-like aspartic protease family protein [Thiopseudomonas denitrificans]|uniref:Aspartyl protease family protein n=1 Tax=Thiopseudomonas denitrificans TaxID=1501432 RepID=A0A4R6TU19_9GAMM|nr:TIGR02281 family clan AA aspartic protease [Thiopseudomonas denitrificans]TDQ36831.1 aspartyl protease family protein [Thiopseudomonas denitrificans]
MVRYVVFLAIFLCNGVLQAEPVVRVVGLFSDAAVVNIDGQRTLLKAGQEGPKGIRLVSADSRGAVLSINGRQQRMELARDYNQGGYSTPEKQRLVIARGRGGHYWINGSVNGNSMPFLLDTGASSVALNEAQARRLGIDFKTNGRPMQVTTASGVERGWQVSLRSVKVGAIEVLGVEAVVLEGSFPTDALLGMSFLNRIGWRQEQDALILEAKY